VDATRGVGNRHGVVARAHPASTRGMPDADGGLANKFLGLLFIVAHAVDCVPFHDHLLNQQPA
jgi:hypothetical protein